MKNLTYLMLIAIFTGFMSCSTNSGTSKFEIKRGVNISHWLSQSEKRGSARDTFFTEKDVAFIASIGYDHIRLPIDEEQMWDTAMNKNTQAFKLMHNAIEWCEKYNLKTIVDLHIIRSHHFNNQVRPLWTSPKEQDKFITMWKELSADLKKYPHNMVAYELMNEAVTDDPDNWNNLIERSLNTIRKNEPLRTIVIGSNMWQSANTFDQLKIPNDTNLILSFHFYTPMPLTHYNASWTKVGEYKGPVNYPGQLIDTIYFKELPEDLVKTLRWDNGIYNRDTLARKMEKPIRVAKEHKLPLYCGEFGCLPSIDINARMAWYNDMVTIFNTNGIAWANWDYKGGFGIIDGKTEKPVDELIKVLLPQK